MLLSCIATCPQLNVNFTDMAKPDKVLITQDEAYTNPIGVTYEDDKIVLVQGASTITMSRSQLSQLNEPREIKKD